MTSQYLSRRSREQFSVQTLTRNLNPFTPTLDIHPVNSNPIIKIVNSHSPPGSYSQPDAPPSASPIHPIPQKPTELVPWGKPSNSKNQESQKTPTFPQTKPKLIRIIIEFGL
jgi:hypothetical protein